MRQQQPNIIHRLLSGNTPLFTLKGDEDNGKEFARFTAEQCLSGKFPIINLDNVAEFYAETFVRRDSDDHIMLPKIWNSLPRSFSPFTMSVAFFRVPDDLYDPHDCDPSDRHEAIMSTVNMPVNNEQKREIFNKSNPFRIEAPAQTRHIFMTRHLEYTSKHNCIIVSPTIVFIFTDERGVVVDNPLRVGNPKCSYEQQASMQIQHLQCSIICMLGNSFISCKNTEIIDASDEYNFSYGRKYKGQKLPPITWHKIRVDGSLKTYSRNSRKQSEGDKHRLHICRGHFATYDESGKGLFGRGQYGTFWIPQHMRGNKDLGQVNKVYEVIAGGS